MELRKLEAKTSRAIEAVLAEIADYQKQYSDSRQQVGPFTWNEGAAGNLPIIRETSVQCRLASRLCSTLGDFVVLPECRVARGSGRFDLGLLSSTGVVPIEIKSFPPTKMQKELNNTRNDAVKLARSQSGLCFYVVATSFANHEYDWEKCGCTVLADELRSSEYSGRCVVHYLQAEVTTDSRRQPTVISADFKQEVLQV